MKHTEKTIEKFKKVSIDKKNNDEKFFSRGTSNRLDYSKPAPTLVPGHSSFQIHPVEHRSITVREGALITGFPKEYKFFGSHTSRCMQIGNAIPVNMAKNIALKCKEYLDDVLV
jgi:DNA (cytosine-5)-methyltransferase 1